MIMIIMIISNNSNDVNNNNNKHEMKREQTSSGCIFACCIPLALSWPLLAGFGTEPITSVTILVSKYGGKMFLGMRLYLASAQDHT